MTTENIVYSFEQWRDIVTPIWNLERTHPNYLLDIYAVFYFAEICDGFMIDRIAKKDGIEYEAKTERASSIDELISFKQKMIELEKKILLLQVIYCPSLPSYYIQDGNELKLRETPIMTPANWLIQYSVV